MGAPIIRYEAGQTAYPFEAAADSGDATVFDVSFAPISNVAGSEPVIAPYGILTGGAITTHATDDTVTVAALTASMMEAMDQSLSNAAKRRGGAIPKVPGTTSL